MTERRDTIHCLERVNDLTGGDSTRFDPRHDARLAERDAHGTASTEAYIDSISALYLSTMIRRFSLSVGVSSSLSGSQNCFKTTCFLICSTLASSVLARAIASDTALSISADETSASMLDASSPCCAAYCASVSGSRTTRAVKNGRASPIAITAPISELSALTAASTFAGEMFLPAALTMISFLRPVMERYPSASMA